MRIKLKKIFTLAQAAPRLLGVLLFATIGIFSQAVSADELKCDWRDPRLIFLDGVESCITKQTEFFSLKGLGGDSSSLRDSIKAHAFYALAAVRDPETCPSAVGIAWNWPQNETPAKAKQFCEQKFSKAISTFCQCEVILNQGQSPLTEGEFKSLIHRLHQQIVNGGAPLVTYTGVNIQERIIAPVPDVQAVNGSHEAKIQASEAVKAGVSNKFDQIVVYERGAAEQEAMEREAELTTERQRVTKLRAELERMRQKAEEAQAELESARERQARDAQKKLRKRLALVIGNNAYQHISRLDNAVPDARAISDLLVAYDYDVQVYYNLNERQFKSALRSFQRQMSGGEEVVFYYAGHGVQIDGVNFLLPTDIGDQSARQIEDEGIPLQRILSDFSQSRAKFSLAMVDACRDNPFQRIGRQSVSRGLAPTRASTGQMIIFSAGVGQQALDRLGEDDRAGNGIFARVLIKKIQESNEPVHQIMRDVRAEVARLASSIGHEQVPAIYDQAIGDFFFK